ncbi:MAG: helix-turn-helix transcriptional regulator [Paracoccaceae bacterium]
MTEQLPPRVRTLGADLRALRKARGLTLEDMARALDKSVGWMSQVERDISAPRMRDLRAIAALFDVPLSLFFGAQAGPAEEAGLIVRSRHRRIVGVHDSGLVETLLSPDLTDSFEVIHSTFQPGSARAEDTRRDTQEPRLSRLWPARHLDRLPGLHRLGGRQLPAAGQAYRWSNPYERPAVAVWVISPVY